MDEFLNNIKSILGPKGYFENPIVMAPLLADMRGKFFGKVPLIARPKSTAEVSEIVKLCNIHNVAMTPQGGNTGLCAGATPIEENSKKILINLSRMTNISPIKDGERSISLEVGATLGNVQEAASEKGLLFPLSLASEGSCQIGGNISTNAGGIHVLKYGTMRSMVLGLEVVLPNGGIWNGTSSLLKNTAGYDLKQMFIGAEGTLGIITKASLKLFSKPKGMATLLIGSENLPSLINTYNYLKTDLGEDIAAFEVFPDNALNFVLKHIPNTRKPFPLNLPWYGLIEIWGADQDAYLLEKTLNPIEKLINKNIILDVLVANSLTQRNEFWKLRESLSEAQKIEGDSIKNDISIPPNLVGEFTKLAQTEVKKYMPGIRVTPFGHAGDGNLHFNLMQPKGMAKGEFFNHQTALKKIVNSLAVKMGGSISAEHGIGRSKRMEFKEFSDPMAYELMKTVKKALDPSGLMNPGALF